MRAVASIVVLVGSMLLASVVVSGCGDDAPNAHSAPEFAYRGYRTALATRDPQAIEPYLGPRTLAHLERLSAAMTAQGFEPRTPAEMLAVAWVPGAVDIASVDRVAYDDDHAVLRVTTSLGHEAEVTMLREDGRWTTELDFGDDAGDEP